MDNPDTDPVGRIEGADGWSLVWDTRAWPHSIWTIQPNRRPTLHTSTHDPKCLPRMIKRFRKKHGDNSQLRLF